MQKINKYIIYFSVNFILLTTQLGLAIEEKEKINIPAPKCFIESTCLIKSTQCNYTDNDSYFIAVANIKVKNSYVCVAYNGVTAKFTSDETSAFVNTYHDKTEAKDGCESYLNRVKFSYDRCR